MEVYVFMKFRYLSYFFPKSFTATLLSNGFNIQFNKKIIISRKNRHTQKYTCTYHKEMLEFNISNKSFNLCYQVAPSDLILYNFMMLRKKFETCNILKHILSSNIILNFKNKI